MLESSLVATRELVRAVGVTGTAAEVAAQPSFSIATHRSAVHDSRRDSAATLAKKHEDLLVAHSATLSVPQQRRLQRCKDTGAWLSALPNPHTRTALSHQEWCDNVHLRLGLTPAHLPARCDGCQRPFHVIHALNCGCGGLIHLRHNEIRDELLLAALDNFPPHAATREPQLQPVAAQTLPHGLSIHAAPPPL